MSLTMSLEGLAPHSWSEGQQWIHFQGVGKPDTLTSITETRYGRREWAPESCPVSVMDVLRDGHSGQCSTSLIRRLGVGNGWSAFRTMETARPHSRGSQMWSTTTVCKQSYDTHLNHAVGRAGEMLLPHTSLCYFRFQLHTVMSNSDRCTEPGELLKKTKSKK